MRPTHKDAAVIYVDGDGKTHEGVIADVFTTGAGRITLSDNSTVQTSYSEKGEPGTFHYPDEAEAVKKAQADAKAQEEAAKKAKSNPKSQPAANAPAQSAAAPK
jgi:hypothetical protein